MSKKLVSRNELKERGLINKEAFYQGISEMANHLDPETVEKVYGGLVRHVTQELRRQGAVDLPFLGHFALVEQKSRSALVGKTRQIIPKQRVLKFFPLRRWREYFRKALSP